MSSEVDVLEQNTGKEFHEISESLKEIVEDGIFKPEAKAQAIHERCVDMMKCLWKNPSGERIGDFKKSVVCVVDSIMTDAATTKHLLNLTGCDNDARVHSVNVGLLALALAKELFKNQNRHDLYALGAGFFLHDLGKAGMDESIVNKSGNLTDEEMTILKRHPGMGFKRLNETRQITDESRIIVLQHHERSDGKGYPKGLRDPEIHLYGRICSVADIFDALVSNQVSTAQKKQFEALRIMKLEMIEHFHKDVFQAFVMLFI